MAVPVAVGIALAAWETILLMAETIELLAGHSPEQQQDTTRKLDKLLDDIAQLRNELRESGQTILREIERNRQLVQLFELNRMMSLGESALHSLQAVRVGAAELKDDALRDSDLAVTELFNAQQFADRNVAIGPFLFVGNARLQIVAELAPALLSEPSFRAQVQNWINIVRQTADLFEAAIRANKAGRVEEDEKRTTTRTCEVVDGTRVCEYQTRIEVTVTYSNLSGTITFFRFVGEDPAARQQARREANALVEPGRQADLEQFGVNTLRKTANAWEGILRNTIFRFWMKKMLSRDLIFAELSAIKLSPHLEVDQRSLVRGLIQSSEFRRRFDLRREQEDDPALVGDLFVRVTSRQPSSEEAAVLYRLLQTMGYESFAAALGSLAPPLKSQAISDPKKRDTGDGPPLSTVTIFRTL